MTVPAHAAVLLGERQTQTPELLAKYLVGGRNCRRGSVVIPLPRPDHVLYGYSSGETGRTPV